jgi:hypothetical protein
MHITPRPEYSAEVEAKSAQKLPVTRANQHAYEAIVLRLPAIVL